MTVSQGSAAMSLRCGGICNDHFVENCVLSLAVKVFWKLFNISQSYRHEWGVLFCLTLYYKNIPNTANSTLSTCPKCFLSIKIPSYHCHFNATITSKWHCSGKTVQTTQVTQQMECELHRTYKHDKLTKLPADSDNIRKNIGGEIHWHVKHLQVWQHNTKVLMHWCKPQFGISLDSILVKCWTRPC